LNKEFIWLREEEKQREKEKRKDIPILECRIPKNGEEK